MTEEKKNPEMIEDKDLDETNAGIALLVPAVQKIREAANSAPSSGNTYTGQTTVNEGTLQATPPKP